MKILELKLKNINSLAGVNTIDFTDPIFTNDGLFAITGKTGAGKSSILDAISLAFYGKTPRVDVTGNENAVMTRSTKDCFAEIVFEVAGKKWKSSWKQERTKTGVLKPVERAIADESNVIVADKISIKGERKNSDEKTVGEKIVEILGLTFEQFTKVIMLAQGSFAAFLQAKNDEKGELLEQITGTEIYAEISKKVFERNKLEKEKFEKILLELEAIKILSEEEIENLTAQIVVFEKDKKQVDEELRALEESKKWLSDIQMLDSQIKAAKQKLPNLVDTEKRVSEIFAKADRSFKEAKKEQEKQEPVFKKVRELDIKISEKEGLLLPILKEISELERSKKKLSDTLDEQVENQKSEQGFLIEKQNWEIENSKYEGLVSDYTAIENQNSILRSSAIEIENFNSIIGSLKTDLADSNNSTKAATINFNSSSDQYDIKVTELKAKQGQLDDILGGKQVSEIQLEKDGILNLSFQIKNVIDLEIAISNSQKEIEGIDEKLQVLEKQMTEAAHELVTGQSRVSSLENQIRLLQDNIELTKAILSLDEHRNNLKDGEECLLCGSLEHPFAIGNIPILGDKEIDLLALKKDFQVATNDVIISEKKIAKLLADRDHALERKEKEQAAFSDNSEKQKVVCNSIEEIKSIIVQTKGDERKVLLEKMLEVTKFEFDAINTTITEASNAETALIKLRTIEIPFLQDSKQKEQKLLSDAVIAEKLLEQQLKNKMEVVEALIQKYKTENEVFLAKMKNFSADNIDELRKRLKLWQDNIKEKQDLELKIAALDSSIALNRQELEGKTKAHDQKKADKKNIEGEKQILLEERGQIFSDKILEYEENHLREVIVNSELEKTRYEKEKYEARTELEKINAIVTEKEIEILKLKEENKTVNSIEELQFEFDEKKKYSDNFLEKIGADKQKLESNIEKFKSIGNKLKEKELQKSKRDEWGTLNELIGSSDGKKYRNFAQALTFEQLIGVSNRQLKKMSDRYTLKRTGDLSSPFELSVIDEFHNSEERTAQNLSGGEKFIISLSLALGLANMASKNMRIDTMFIDEGFGTLDPDYLDVALNALSNLQSEGKVIGVISHLTELKERIATHVEVYSVGNGHSNIQIRN